MDEVLKGTVMPKKLLPVLALILVFAISAHGALRQWEPSDCVQDALELHLDGKRNAGAGLAHDSAAVTWVDLSGNGRDATLNKPEGSSSTWRVDGTGFSFSRDAWFETSEEFSLGTSYTMEILSSFNRANTHATTATFISTAGGANSGRVFYKKSDSIFHRGDKMFGSVYNNSPALPISPSATYLTAIRDGSRAAIITNTCYPVTSGTVDGSKVLDWFEGSLNVAMPTNKWFIGGVPENGSVIDLFVGSIRSVRLYSRLLSEDELAWNRAIDDVRYFSRPSVITATPVASAIPDAIIATSVEGLNGNETCGAYVVDEDGYAFSALGAVSAGNVAYACKGYTLEKWDGGAWGAPVTNANETVCFVSAGDKVRITWLWETATGTISRVNGAMPPNGAIAVASAVKGLSGREPDGVYCPDGWTFTAGEGIRKTRGMGWRCVGYQLQTWDAETSAWGAQETVTVQNSSRVEYVPPAGTEFVSKRLIWLWEQTMAARTAADYSPADYAYGTLELHLDGKSHGDSSDVWNDLSGNSRDASLVVYDGSSGNVWNDSGFYFNAGAHFITAGAFALGHISTIEIFADAPVANNQPNAGATLIAPVVGVAYGAVFYKKNNRLLSYRTDSLTLAEYGTAAYLYRPSIAYPGTIGHMTAARDGNRAAIFTGTEYPTNEEDVSDSTIQGRLGWGYGISDNVAEASQWTIGGFSHTDTSYALKGTIKSVRVYDRLLTEDELARNREIDNIRFTGQLPVTNVVVVAGGEGAVQAEAGAYKVEGEWTFTASKTVNRKGEVVDVARYAIEEFVDGAWVNKTLHDGNAYTYAVGTDAAKVRLTWLGSPRGMGIIIR